MVASFDSISPFSAETAFLVLVLCALGAYFYRFVNKKQSYWQERGVKCRKPTFFTGHIDLLGSKSLAEQVQDVYNHFPEERYHGMYQLVQPVLVIRDPNLIKQITVKDFDHFVNHRQFVVPDLDPLWGKNLLTSRDDRWRDLRSTISPSFTSSKMRLMFNLMDKCARQFVQYFVEDPSEVIELEMKDMVYRYTNDVIASTTFGVECHSLQDKNNEFYLMGKDVSNVRGARIFKFIAAALFPTMAKLVGIRIIPAVVADYFSKIIEETVRIREEKHIVRADMIHLLMEARKGRHHSEEETALNEGFSSVSESDLLKNRSKQEITLEDITAQAIAFFLGGFESVATLLCFAFYELAVHPDIQDRLREEINTITEITYEAVLRLKYLDMVVSETLRMWPPTLLTDRQVTKDFKIEPENTDEKTLVLQEGVVCSLHIYAIHRDPNNFPDPDKFDPERFNDDNKHSINPSTYLPFGAGPRNCIGSRFALLESKLLLCHVLKSFEIVPIAKTNVPMALDRSSLTIVSKGGMWLGMKKLGM